MIENTLTFIKDEINKFMNLQTGSGLMDEKVVLSNIVNTDQSTAMGLPIDKMVLSLICIEEERHLKAQDHYARTADGTLYSTNPELRFNLFVLFAAHFSHANYSEALKFLGLTLRFFQAKNVFDAKEFPELAADVKRIIVDLHTQPIEQQSQLWQAMGGKFLPSIMYKIRLLTVNEQQAQNEAIRIAEVKR
jgi:hypothetical protein